MNMRSEKSGTEILKGVMLAHLILGLHVVVLILIVVVVIFFGGIARYWAWIVMGGLVLTALVGFWVYRKLKAQGRNLYRDIRGISVPAGAALEVSFLGGLASVKFARPSDSNPKIEAPVPPALLEDPATMRVRELAHLAQMYEKNLISREEFEHAKGILFNPPPS
jgi:hypothetical protein